MSISEGLDRCVDDFTNINEDTVLDQTESHHLMELKMKLKEIARGPENTLRKDYSIRDQFLWTELHKRLMRKSSIIDDLLYSKQNLTVVKENLGQFDDVFKLTSTTLQTVVRGGTTR